MINDKTWGYGKKIVGFKELVDPGTGEITIVNKINRPVKDFGWEKIWLESLLKAFDILGHKPFFILKYFFENRNYENKVFTNKSMISRSVGVSRLTVYGVIEKLIENDIIKPIEMGFQVNPDIIFNSLEAHRKKITRLQVILDYHDYDIKDKKMFTFEI